MRGVCAEAHETTRFQSLGKGTFRCPSPELVLACAGGVDRRDTLGSTKTYIHLPRPPARSARRAGAGAGAAGPRSLAAAAGEHAPSRRGATSGAGRGGPRTPGGARRAARSRRERRRARRPRQGGAAQGLHQGAPAGAGRSLPRHPQRRLLREARGGREGRVQLRGQLRARAAGRVLHAAPLEPRPRGQGRLLEPAAPERAGRAAHGRRHLVADLRQGGLARLVHRPLRRLPAGRVRGGLERHQLRAAQLGVTFFWPFTFEYVYP